MYFSKISGRRRSCAWTGQVLIETQLLRLEKIFKMVTKSHHQRWGRDGALPVPSHSSDIHCTALALGIVALQTPWSH